MAKSEEGSTVPKKIGLNWFMPALAKRRLGSACGTTEEDLTGRWISTKPDIYLPGDIHLTEFMAMLVLKELEERLADMLGRPFDLEVAVGGHGGRDRAVLFAE